MLTSSATVRTSPKRFGLATILSFIGHLIIVFWGFWKLDVGLDAPEFELEFAEIEMIDPDLLQGEDAEEPAAVEEPPPVVAPPEPPPVETPETDDGEKVEEEEPEPKKQFGEKTSKVDKLAPANSTFFLLLANRKIAKLPFADEAIEIMAPQRDFRYLIDEAGFHPFEDFNYIVMASSDIRDLTQTFLAVDYRLSKEEIKAGLAIAAEKNDEILEWEIRDGIEMANPRPKKEGKKDWDPRYFVFVEEGVACYVREEFLDQILSGGGEAKTSGNFVANIVKLKKFARREPRAGLQMVAKDMRAALKSAKGLPFEFPDTIEVMAEASTEPEMVIKLSFLSADHAKDMERYWKKDLKRTINGDIKIKLVAGGFYNATEVERKGKTVQLRASFTQAQTASILKLIADGSRKMMDKSNAEMEKRRREREKAWKSRGAAGAAEPTEQLDTPGQDGSSPEPGDEPEPAPPEPEAAPPEPASGETG